MKALINYKICDNAKECGGIEVCPTGAMHFDEAKKTIMVDEDKCINCKTCVPACPIGAIMVASNQEQYLQFQKDIENDPRKVKDLFVDRYGATPLSTFFSIKPNDLDTKIATNKLILVEVYDDDSIECLMKSIPIKEICQSFSEDLLYFKLKANQEIKQKYKIKQLPTLLVFRQGKFIGMIEGYYTTEEKETLQAKLDKIICK